jgi:iron-sulfur cluster insertion protein
MNQFIVDQSAIDRIKEVTNKIENRDKFLRITVSSGGCSGFQYLFSLDHQKNSDDLELYQENSQILVVSDESSINFIQGAKLEFVNELGAQYFKISNPNAKANCGCGSSFSV